MDRLTTECRVTFGSDPELFIKANGSKKRFIAADRFLQGKDEPEKIGDKGHSMFYDGFQAEINPAPSTCRQEHTYAVSACLIALLNKLENHGVEIKVQPSCKVTKKEIMSASPAAREFGCDPAFDPYQAGMVKTSPMDATNHPYRYAGGHVHVTPPGFVKWNDEQKRQLIILMDYIVGNTCVLLDQSKEAKIRRKHYGTAGEYRFPKHGVEYRVLSNFWIKHPALSSLVLALSRQAVIYFLHRVNKAKLTYNETPCAHIEESYANEFFKRVPAEDIIRAINTNSYKLALKNFKKLIPLFISVGGIEPTEMVPFTKKTIKELFLPILKLGVEKVYSDDLIKNWDIVKNPVTKTFVHGNSYGVDTLFATGGFVHSGFGWESHSKEILNKTK